MNGSSPGCPCDKLVHPQVISNPPGLSSVAYRVGDYTAFREALLRAIPGEIELANWRPGAQGDLAVQMVEWWAYLADILTFYNQRIANQDYLTTADLPESPASLIALLGYRPRPGVGATGTVAALMTGNNPFTLPQGFQIQSKPGPGQQPQIFGTGQAAQIQQPDSISADPAPNPSLLGIDGASVLLSGVITSVSQGDTLLLIERDWSGTDGNYAILTVASTSQEKDPRGNKNTRVVFTQAPTQLNAAAAADYRLLKSSQSTQFWQYSAPSILSTTQVDLASIVRGIRIGDPVLFQVVSTIRRRIFSVGGPSLASVTSYSEVIWYANSAPGDPAEPPSGSPAPIAIPIPHTHLGLRFFQSNLNAANSSNTTVEYNWRDVGKLIPTPATSLSGNTVILTSSLPGALLPMAPRSVLISDTNGNGIECQASASASDPYTLTLSGLPSPLRILVPPLTVLFNLLYVSRGQTVSNESLGSGDATLATGQEFILQKSPLTYLQNTDPSSGAAYRSTLQVFVDGVQWKEVPSFYGQAPNARVFVTYEDFQNRTHVQFGDGNFASRLPSGVNNVSATYRYGCGATPPSAGALSVVLKSWPGLKSVVNPVAAGGGADPDSPQQIQTDAPRSVLTFGRAISADDYEAIAAEAPGIARAKAYSSWDAAQGRMLVKIYVGNDARAVSDAQLAIADAADPNKPVNVLLANPVAVTLSFTVIVDPGYPLANVQTAVIAAITDPTRGLLGVSAVKIGESIWQSQIYQACQSVAGVIAVQNLQFAEKLSRFQPLIRPFLGSRFLLFRPAACQDVRLDPGEGGYFQLAATDFNPSWEVAPNAG